MKPFCSLITTVKNRSSHFLQTFPSLSSQVGVPYELVIVDLQSQDGLDTLISEDLPKRREIFSPDLLAIKRVRFRVDTKFNPRKAKNSAAGSADPASTVLAFSDIDVFLSMNYLRSWISSVEADKSFVTMRVQDTMASMPRRVSPEINYGNCFIAASDYKEVGGFDESVVNYGGDDDDLYHRLKCKGLREINPKDRFEALHYSIVHGDDLRLANFEHPSRCDKDSRFKEIYQKTDHRNPHSQHLQRAHLDSVATIEILYSRT